MSTEIREYVRKRLAAARHTVDVKRQLAAITTSPDDLATVAASCKAAYAVVQELEQMGIEIWNEDL